MSFIKSIVTSSCFCVQTSRSEYGIKGATHEPERSNHLEKIKKCARNLDWTIKFHECCAKSPKFILFFMITPPLVASLVLASILTFYPSLILPPLVFSALLLGAIIIASIIVTAMCLTLFVPMLLPIEKKMVQLGQAFQACLSHPEMEQTMRDKFNSEEGATVSGKTISIKEVESSEAHVLYVDKVYLQRSIRTKTPKHTGYDFDKDLADIGRGILTCLRNFLPRAQTSPSSVTNNASSPSSPHTSRENIPQAQAEDSEEKSYGDILHEEAYRQVKFAQEFIRKVKG